MGGLSSGPGPGICFLALCLLVLAQQSQSAPVQEDNVSLQSRSQGYYDGGSSELSSGCYYNFQHYGEGDRIITNEPCLNCTCRNRMLMCYLRVCPFTKAIGQNCTIEKKPGQCCPLIICPEVPVQLLTSSTTTEHSESSHKTQLGYGHHGTGVGHLDDYGCRINGEFYTNGAQIPGNIDKPCEVCYCIRNRTACIMQECTLQVDGCIPVYEEGLCCPVRYQCDYDYSYNAITTEEPRPTPGLVLTTTSGPFECQHDGKWYADGSSVDTEDPCEHCYCMKGDIVCAVQECKPPFEKDGHNCTAMPPAPGKCCPDSYHCANVTMSITSSTSSSDKHHGWNYGTNANEKDTPNRFTDEQNKDGTTVEDGHMMITEGIPPTLGPLESGSHHLEGHYEGKPVSEGHGVNTDNMLTISQVIQSIVHNQTQLLNQNRLNQSLAGSGKPVQQPGGVAHDDKIHFPVDQAENEKKPPFHDMQTDDDGNPLESHSTATELPEDYYGFTGGSSDIYAEHSGRPQTRPTKPSKRPQPGQAIFGEHGHFGRPIKRPGSVTIGEHEGTDEYQGTTDLPEGYTGQTGKRPITHKVPGADGTSFMTDEMGNPMEGVHLTHRPISHKPGMTESDEGVTKVHEGITGIPEGFTGRPVNIGTSVYYDEHGRPHLDHTTRPVGQKQPTTNDETSTGILEAFTGKPGVHLDIFGEHGHSGRPLKKPVEQKRPGMTDETGSTGIYDEYAESFTGKPEVHGSDEDRVTGTAGRPSGIHKRPSVHMRPGMEDGTTETTEGFTSHHGIGMYGGRPQKRPGMTESVTNKDETLLEGVTKMPGHYDISGIFGEHGRPQKPAQGPDGMMVTTGEAEGMTEIPEGADITYDKLGRPKPGIHKKPGQIMTDENGNPIETATSSPVYNISRPDNDDMDIIHDKYGRPHRRPIHKKPDMDGEVTTNEYEQQGTTEIPAHTEIPDVVIMYDPHGRPIKLPIHKKPSMNEEYTPTDKDGKPTEGETEQTEGHTGAPDYAIYYDEFGRPHKMPFGVKRPGVQILTDANGKPLEGQEVITQTPEEFIATPEGNVIYDGHGRPFKSPIHTPGMDNEQASTDKHGNPIYGTIGTPETDHTEMFYDKHGRPIKPTTAQIKPGMHSQGDTTDEHEEMPDVMIVYDKNGRPIKKPIRKKPGVHGEHSVEGMTEKPEGQTFTPDNDDGVFYDEYGNPIRPSVAHKQPGTDDEHTHTDKYEKPVYGTTETPESQTETSDGDGTQTVYDEHGGPIKRPIYTKPEMVDDHTDKFGKPVEGMTETPDGLTGRPNNDDDQPMYEQFGRPTKRPIHKKPGTDDATTDKPADETVESHTGSEASEIFGEHGHTGRPQKKPVRGPDGIKVTTEETEGMSAIPEDHTDRPDGEVYYDEHGRPKPGVHLKPLEDHEIMTESPGHESSRPESDSFVIYFDKYGRPHRRPIHKKPGSLGGVLIDEQGNPLEGVTGTVPGFTDKPLTSVFFGEHGHTERPYQHPGLTGEGEKTEEYEGTTNIPQIYGEHGHAGRPHKRPVINKKPGMDMETDEYQSGRPEIHYDENGRPQKKPGKPGKPEDGEEMTEGHTDEPQKRPVVQKPDEDVMTDSITDKPEEGLSTAGVGETVYGKPGQLDMTDEESSTGEPAMHEDGRPVKQPVIHKRPHGTHGTSEEETSTYVAYGTTERPDGYTSHPLFGELGLVGRPHHKPTGQKHPGIPGITSTGATESNLGTEVYYDEHGRPLVQKLPDEDGKPLDEYAGTTESPEQHTRIPEFMIVYDKNGLPIKKPGSYGEHTPTDQYGKPIESMTETPYGQTLTPDSDGVYYDMYGNLIRPGAFHKKPSTPGEVVTDEEGKPLDEQDVTTEIAEGHTGMPDFMIIYDKNGRPIKKPIRKKPGIHGELTPSDKYGKPVEGMTESPEAHTGAPDDEADKVVYDKYGRPIGVHEKPGMDDEYTTTDKYGKPVYGMAETPESNGQETVFDEHGRPVAHKKPGMDGEPKPTDEYGQSVEGMTMTPEAHSETPDFVIMYDNHGRPIKTPVHKTPGMHVEFMQTDKDGKPAEWVTEQTEGHSREPDYVIFYDQFGRPHKMPVGHKPVLTDDTGKPLSERNQTGKPEVASVYGAYGRPVTPTTPQIKPEQPEEDVMTDEYTEDHTGTPDFMIVYDQNGRPIKKPIMGEDHATTNKYGKPVEEMTETPEEHTDIPEDLGRPIHNKPDENAPTVKYGRPAESVTEVPEGHTGSQDSDDQEPDHSEQQGIDDATTDKYGKPLDEAVESQTGSEIPEIFGEYGHSGRPQKKPIHGPDGAKVTTDETEGMTETTGGQRPNGEVYYDEHGQPTPGVHKRPGVDEDGRPLDKHTGTTETSEGHTEIPEFIIVYDKNGRPIKKPIGKRPGVHGEQPVEGMNEVPESQTGTPESDDKVFYDKHGNPIRPDVFHKKPSTPGEVTDEEGKPLDGQDVTTEIAEGQTGTPEYMIVYDKNGLPIKKPIRKRPGWYGQDTLPDHYGRPIAGMTEKPEGQTFTPDNDDGVFYDEYGNPIRPSVAHKQPGTDDEHTHTDKYEKPVYGTTETPESQTETSDGDGTQTVYDEHGGPIKRPIYTKPEMVDDHTDKFGKPVEGMTETPDGLTGRPNNDDDQPMYEQFGRPTKRPIHKKPGTDDATTDKPADETVESHTGSEASEIFGEHGHTGRPQKKPVRGPDGIKVTTEETEGMSAIPEDHTDRPDGEVYYDEHGRPKPGVHKKPEIVTEDRKQVHGLTEAHTIEPDKEGSVTEHSRPQERPTDGHEESMTFKPGVEHDLLQGKPEAEHAAVHPVHEYEVVTMLPEDHTGKPESDSHHIIPDEYEQAKPQITEDEMTSTSQPYVDQKKPGVGDAMTPEKGMEALEDHTQRPGNDIESHARPGTHDGDHTAGSPITHNETGRPQEGSNAADPHKRPQDVEKHSNTTHVGSTGAPEGALEQHSKPEEAPEVPKKPGDHVIGTSEDGLTGKPVQIHYDEFGRPHQHPIQTQTDDVHNEVPEEFTVKPDQKVPGLLGKPGQTGLPHKRPVSRPGDDEMHTTELPEGSVHFVDQGRPQKKPVTSNDIMVTEESDSDTPSGTTEPQLFGESGRPHKKPIRKPGSGVADDGDQTQKQPELEDHTGVQEEVPTGKPDHDSPLTLFGENGRPTKKPIKPVDDDEGRPEENEISEGEKETDAPEGERVTTKPEGTKVAEPSNGTGEDTEGKSTTGHPEVSGQYLPPKKPDTNKEPEGTMDGKPHKPVQTTDDHPIPEENDDEDDESLIITTDEPEEETEGVHSHEDGEPTDTKTKIPEESGKPHDEVYPTTPGLGLHTHDFTTPGYGTHDGSLTVTDGATHGHPVTQGVDGQLDLSHMGSDGVSFPGANVVFDKDGKPHIIPGHHDEFGPTPGYEDEMVPHGGGESHNIQQPTSVSTPEDESTEGATVVFSGDGKPHTVFPHEKTPDLKVKPESPLPEGKPMSTPTAGTTEKTPSLFPGIPTGFLPSFGEVDSPNTDAPIMIDGGLNEGSPFDAVLDSLANVLRPMHTTEKAAETTEAHKEVPGEGSCFIDDVTYPNNSEVPPLSPCHTKCTCISSIIHCLSLKCPSPPEDVSHCTTIHDEKSCCPTYICDETSTSSAENQEVTTDPEDEHGSSATETSEDEDGDHTPVKTETHQSEMDADKPEEYSPTMKPEVDHVYPVDHEKEPEQGSMLPRPAGIEVPTDDPQAPMKGQSSENLEESTLTKPGRPQRPQAGYFPASSDEHHPSTVLPSYFGTGKPVTIVEEHPDQQRPDSDDHVLGIDELTKGDKRPADKEQPMTTDGHKPHEGIGEPEAPMKVTEEEPAMPDGQPQVKKPEHHRPSTPEDHPEVEKPHETATSDDQEGPTVRPHEKPVESSLQEGHKPYGEETGNHKVEDNTEPSEEHKKPSIHPSSSNEESALTTASPHERPSGSEEPFEGVEHHKPGVTGEEDTYGRPDHDAAATEIPQSGPATNKIPATHDMPSEEDKDNKHTMTTDQPEEQYHTHTLAATGQPEETHPEHETFDKVHSSTDHPTSEEHHKKPEDATGEVVTLTPEQFPTSKPIAPSGVFTDFQKKPEADAPEAQEPTHEMTEKPHDHAEGEEPHEESEAPQKKPEDSALPTDEKSGHTTMRPHLQSSEGEEGKPETVRPTSVDSVSESIAIEEHSKPTTGDEDAHKPQTGEDVIYIPQEETQEPQGKPEIDSHSASNDKEVGHFTTRPHGEPTADAELPHPSTINEEFSHTTTGPQGYPSDVEKPHESPEDDLVHPSSEIPQTGVRYPTTEGIDGQSEHDFASTSRPRPEQSTPGHVDHKPEEIPEEVLLHPTRTPGTFQTHRPDFESDFEMTDHRPDQPMVDESMSTFFPEGFFRPVTKRPTIGVDKPEDSMTQRPQSERPDGIGKPVYDVTTDNPAEVSGTFRPKPDFGDFLPGSGIFQKPDEDLGEHEITPHEESTTSLPGLKPGPLKRPIYATNGTHFVQFVPFREGEVPKVPQGAMLGEPEERPDGEKYWPIIFVKPGVSTTEPVAETEKLTPQQVFNGTHFIQYVPFEDGEIPEIPQGATIGQPVKKPDGQVYWPVIDIKPLPSDSEDEPMTHEPFPGQVYNGTHFIQYLPYDEGKPEVPEGATLGKPQTAPNGDKYWPIISIKPIPDEEVTTAGSVEPQPEQMFNGTHFIQYVPFKDGEAPEIPEKAILGQPQKGPDGQIYWPIINTKPIPSEDAPATHVPPVQVFNGTNFIQYVPFKEGETPEIPEGATLGQPQKTPDGEIYWPIIYTKPQPVKPEESLPSQVFNGTHYIQYVPYEEDKIPEVPEDAILGQPQRTPDGQMFWPLIYTKPVTSKPDDEPVTTKKPFIAHLFNGTHHIQYVPSEEGKVPDVPEGATLGQPQKTPDGETIWPLIYGKPVTFTPEDELVTTEEPFAAQLFNGTHHIQYIPFEEGKEPEVPEGATLGQPQRTPEGQTFWPLIYSKPMTSKPEDEHVTTEEPFVTQLFNGTHYIQYIPFTEGFEPQLPEDATIGEPLTRPDGQKYWPIIYEKLPTTAKPEEIQPQLGQIYNGTHFIKYVPYRLNHKPQVPKGATVGQPVKGSDGQMYWPIISLKPLPDLQEGPVKPQVFNGTHYIQYVPYEEEKPEVPEGATLGGPETRPDGQKYWPVISKKPLPGLPTATLDEEQATTEPVTKQIYNGTHYIQYAPYKPGQRPVIPEEATLGKPTKGPNDQMYWPIVYQEPVSGLPITTQEPFDDFEPTNLPVNVQFHNGTHYIQYVPYKPGQRPVVPEDATLGKPVRRPDNQLYWPIIHMKPVEGLPIATQHGPEDDLPTTASVTEQYFNGTHYIQYVPYKPGQRPVIPDEATLGNPTRGPNNQMYWPIIYLRPVPGLPITSQAGPFEDALPTSEPVTEQYFNGTHYIQYVPYKPGQRPILPEGAILGQPTKATNDDLFWPVIYHKPIPGLPITTQSGSYASSTPKIPFTKQVFNGTHYIQYLPFESDQKPMLPEGAILGTLTKGPNGQMYYPVIDTKPFPGIPITTETGLFEDADTATEPVTIQVFNGTHHIHYVPYKPGQRPVIPADAELGNPTKGPNDQMYWPVIYPTPVTTQQPSEDKTTLEDPTRSQLFNGTHYIQYVPYRPTHRPVIPPDAKLGKPMRGQNGQMYWPIIHLKPVPGIPIVTEKPVEQHTPEKGQFFNGTHYIQYVPYIPGHRPVVPEGATLGHPEVKSDGKKYWPIIRSRPTPGIPINGMPYEYTSLRPEQIYNGTHYIQYLPYNPTQMPEVPEGASLGHAQKGPGGQMYWVIISDNPIPAQNFNGTHVVQYVTPVTPEHDGTDEHKPSKPLQVFNGTHYIQYVPYTPGQQPVVPEGAVLGKPTKGPEGETYWPIIYKKRPVGEVPSAMTPHDGQIFNGTHYIRYVPHNPGRRPNVPEGASISQPQKGPDGQRYWVISSKKPIPALNGEPVSIPPGQIYNGTHYIQYVPYNPSQMPQVPEGAVLGHPQKGPEGQMNWVIISDKPLPAQPGTQYVQYVTPVTPEENKFSQGLIHNGTHYIQYVPYKEAQIPHIPNEAILGDLEQGPGGQMYWPIIFRKPPQGPIFNGTHYVTYAPQNTTKDHPFWDYGQYGGTKVKQSTTENYPGWSRPGQNATKYPIQETIKPVFNEYEPGYKPDKRPGGEDSYETIDEDHLIEYPSGSDYDETQEQPYGPGTCRYAGKVYVSAQQIPRDDPCDFCFCFRSDIICLQQSCPPPIPGCHEEPIQGFCCPRYECHVRMATLLNVTSTTTTTTTTLPPHFLSHVYNGAAGRTGCFVQGKAYRVGQAITSASGPCMDCICGGDGKMKCEPKVCTPEPMVRQMMVSTEKAMTANHR